MGTFIDIYRLPIRIRTFLYHKLTSQKEKEKYERDKQAQRNRSMPANKINPSNQRYNKK